jgi:NADH dehydrogenase [ubiquinone] 1 alpha subcomplex assembly factor 6
MRQSNNLKKRKTAEMSLTESETYCLQEVRRHDHDRYLTALFLPPRQRADALALYAFNLEIARTREIVSEPILGQIRLQWWRETIEGIYANKPREHPVVAALSETCHRYGLNRDDLDALIDAREVDMDDAAPSDMRALETYAADTSGLLSRLVMQTLGVTSDTTLSAASEVGSAWALVGLARSVAFHAQHQRIYIPAELLSEYEVEQRRLFDLKPSAGLNKSIERMVGVADVKLGNARAEHSGMTRTQRRGLLLATLADRYIAAMRKVGFDPFAMAARQPPQILRLAWSAWRGAY